MDERGNKSSKRRLQINQSKIIRSVENGKEERKKGGDVTSHAKGRRVTLLFLFLAQDGCQHRHPRSYRRTHRHAMHVRGMYDAVQGERLIDVAAGLGNGQPLYFPANHQSVNSVLRGVKEEGEGKRKKRSNNEARNRKTSLGFLRTSRTISNRTWERHKLQV